MDLGTSVKWVFLLLLVPALVGLLLLVLLLLLVVFVGPVRYPHSRFITRSPPPLRLGFTDVDAMDEYDCCAILNDHTQDVKCLAWHPSQDVCPLVFVAQR